MFCVDFSSSLKLEATCSSETQTTQRYISEDRTLHKHLCGNLKFCLLETGVGYCSEAAFMAALMKLEVPQPESFERA
jgi:hypothetical protein